MARPVPEINAGSMADIAFLLLIFFLVTTTMDSDFGIARLLPQMQDETPQDVKIKQRNVLVVNINFRNDLQVAGEVMPISMLKDKVKDFIENVNDDPTLPEKKEETIDYFGSYKVSRGIVSLTNDNGTSYDMYVSVQNELTAAINELRDKLSMSKFGKKYDKLSEKQQDAVRKIYPMSISEAEPKNIGGGK